MGIQGAGRAPLTAAKVSKPAAICRFMCCELKCSQENALMQSQTEGRRGGSGKVGGAIAGVTW